MAEERLYIEGVYVPLSGSLNPAISKSITDIQEPDKRKATHSKTVRIPGSKEANTVFSHIFEINAVDLTFNPNAKASCRYEVDSEEIILGYIRLNSIVVNDNFDISYDCTMFGTTADFFATIKDGYLTDLYATDGDYEGLDIYDHQLTKEIQQLSWDTEIIINGALEPFAFGQGYVYPLIDYGLSTDQTNFIFTQIPCAIYEKEYLTRLIDWAGFTLQAGGWVDTDDVINHLIIPASPECYQLTDSDIEDREFSANTPEMLSTGTTTSGNLPIGSYSANDQLIFTNEVTDPGLNYNPATGVFTAQYSGVYDFTALIDVNATFTPDTVNNVKTTCDIHGFIIMTFDPNGADPEVQIDAFPFYITSDDAAFVSGARSTSATPTYPDTDYMRNKAWGKMVQSIPIARGVNPPDRYQLTVNGIPMQAGDSIRVYYKAGIFADSTSSFTYNSSSNLFVDSLGTYYSGDATLTISVGSFYNKVVNTVMTEGNTLQMSDVIPANVKMIDYFMSLVKHFNLWVDVNPENPKELIIKTRDNYLGGTVLNIHEKIDRSKDIEYLPMTTLDVRRYLFTWKPDGDYWNQRYTQNWQGEVYGQRQVDVENEFAGQEKVTELIFSPTCMVAPPNSDRVLPTIYQLNDAGQPVTTKHNIRRLYYAGLKPCLNTWNHINYVSVFSIPISTSYATYPYAGHWDDPFTPTLDINFGLVKEVFYDDNLYDIVETDNNVVNKYYGKYLREMTDPESRIANAFVRMRPYDFVNFTFDKLYYWDYAYFRLQQVIDYNSIGEETVKNVFLKINNASDFIATTHTATGNPLPITPDQSGGNVNMTEATSAKGTRSNAQTNNNNYSTKSASVKGEYNYINASANHIDINGDSNEVRAMAKNIKIQGDNNIIEAGVENVTLINTSGETVTESDVVYINGDKTSANTSGTYTPTDTANTNLDSCTPGPAWFTVVNGNQCVVSGYFDADPTTTNTATSFEIDLPIPSAIANIEDVAGTAFCATSQLDGVSIIGSVANNTAVFTWVCRTTVSSRWTYIFKYTIL